MSGKHNKVAACAGSFTVVPSSTTKVAVKRYGEKTGWTSAFETQKTSKALYKDAGGGSYAKFTKTEKAGGFVDKRNGNHAFKQEVNYKSSVKVNNKVKGCTTEYETQVKCKKTTTYHAPKKAASASKPSSGNVRITYYM